MSTGQCNGSELGGIQAFRLVAVEAVVHFQGRVVAGRATDDFGWDTSNRAMGFDRIEHDAAGTDFGTLADLNVA